MSISNQKRELFLILVIFPLKNTHYFGYDDTIRCHVCSRIFLISFR